MTTKKRRYADPVAQQFMETLRAMHDEIRASRKERKERLRAAPKVVSIADRLVCGREGHVPQITIKHASTSATTFYCACLRCGQIAEFPIDPPDKTPD